MSNAEDSRQKDAVIAMFDQADRDLVQAIVDSKDPSLPRAAEIIALAKQLGYKRIGIAHCAGLAAEAEVFEKMLAEHFEVVRAGCRIFDLDLGDVLEGCCGSVCNPLGQAKALADAQTDLNVVMGLCLGHDMLFFKYSTAPATTLVVKDRVHGHNPIAALLE